MAHRRRRFPAIARPRHGAAGRQQVVDQHDALALLHGVLLDLDRVGAVFQRVSVAHCRAGQLALLAQHDEAGAECQGERGGEQEAARFDAGQQVGLVRPQPVGQAFDRRVPGLGVRQQGRDVVEQDAGLGEIRDRADVLLEVDVVVHDACSVQL